MTDTMIAAPAAGWYADPISDTTWRWWDGEHWSEQVRVRETAPAVAPVAAEPVFAPPAYSPEPTYDAPADRPELVYDAPAYDLGSAYDLDATYAPEPTYAPTPVYLTEPTHAPEPTFAPEPTYAPEQTFAAEPTFAPEPTYAPTPVYLTEPVYSPPTAQLAVVSRTAAMPAPIAEAVAPQPFVDHVIRIEPSAPDPIAEPSSSVVLFDADSPEPTYPWDAAIAALEAAQRGSTPIAAPSRASFGRRSTARTSGVVVRQSAQPATAVTESATTPWLWLLAFSLYIWGAVAGLLQGFVLPILLQSGMDVATLQLVGYGALLVGLLPVWVFAGLDIRTLGRRDLPTPSILWMVLLPPIGYFVARAAKLKPLGLTARGPQIALGVVTGLAVLALIAGVALFQSMITTLGIIPQF